MGEETLRLIDGLQHLGLTRLEARVYAALALSPATRTGYDVAQDLGVSRANVYSALKALMRRGMAWGDPGESGTRYRAVPFEQIARHARDEFEQHIEDLAAVLAHPAALPAGLWLGEGLPLFVEQSRKAWAAARRTVHVGASPTPMRALLADWAMGAADKTVSCVCWAGCPPTGCGYCPSGTISARVLGTIPGASCLIADGREAVVLFGDQENYRVLVTDVAPVVAGLLRLTSDPEHPTP